MTYSRHSKNILFMLSCNIFVQKKTCFPRYFSTYLCNISFSRTYISYVQLQKCTLFAFHCDFSLVTFCVGPILKFSANVLFNLRDNETVAR